jgi:hypothetical protein
MENQPNYSGVSGVLESSSLPNLYYPRSNRGAGLVFGNFAVGIAERVGANVARSFFSVSSPEEVVTSSRQRHERIPSFIQKGFPRRKSRLCTQGWNGMR